jgi:hypothetical protein
MHRMLLVLCAIFLCGFGSKDQNREQRREFSGLHSSTISIKYGLGIEKNQAYEAIIRQNTAPFTRYLGTITAHIHLAVKNSSWNGTPYIHPLTRQKNIYLGLGLFSEPKFPRMADIAIFHENSHLLDFVITERNPQAMDEFRKANEKVNILAIRFMYASEREVDSENIPIFSLFDESSYVGLHPNGFGHPYTNANELFASALTVMHFFPEEFRVRLLKLQGEEYEAAFNVYASLKKALWDSDIDRALVRQLTSSIEIPKRKTPPL